MRPVDNFRLRGWRAGRSALGCVVVGSVFGVAIYPSGISRCSRGTTSSVGHACRRRGLRCGCPRKSSSHAAGSVPSVERQRVVNRHGRRTRRRQWRSTRVSLAVLRGPRPPEQSGTEPFSERVRRLCEPPLLELGQGTRAVGNDLKFEERFVTTACVVCMLCMHSVFSTHVWQGVHPVLEQSRIEGACRVADGGGIQGSDSVFPSGVTPPALRA